MVKVPNVVGKTEAAARTSLAGLTIKVTYKSDSTKQEGIVLAQSVKANEVVAKNSTITITVNKKTTTPETPSTGGEDTNTEKPSGGGNTNTTTPSEPSTGGNTETPSGGENTNTVGNNA